MNHSLQRLDTRHSVETPEAIDLDAQLSGPVSRILAFAIDVFIRQFVLLIILLFLAIAGRAGLGMYMVLAFLGEWFYPVFFEVLRNGQTPGKKWMSIAVVNDDLTPVSWSNSITRNLLRFADFLPMTYLFGIVAMCSNDRFQRLGDMAAGTIVIHRPTKNSVDLALPQVPSEAPPIPVSLDDQVAFTGFSQRSATLSDQRKEELADILEPITQRRGNKAVEYIQGVGNWLLGDRR